MKDDSDFKVVLSVEVEGMPEVTLRQCALKLIAALDETASPNRVLNGALKVAIIAQANSLKKKTLKRVDYWIERHQDDLTKAEEYRQEVEAWPDEEPSE